MRDFNFLKLKKDKSTLVTFLIDYAIMSKGGPYLRWLQRNKDDDSDASLVRCPCFVVLAPTSMLPEPYSCSDWIVCVNQETYSSVAV